MLPLRATSNPVPVQPESFADPIPAQNTSIRFVSEFINVTFRDMVHVTAEYQFRNSENADVKQTVSLPFIKIPYNLSLSIGNQSVRSTWGQLRLGSRYFVTYTFDMNFKPLEQKNLTATFRVYHEQDNYWNRTSNETGARYEFTYLTTTGRAWGRPIEKATFVFNVMKDACDIGPSLDYWHGYEMTTNDSWVILKDEKTDWTPGSDIAFNWVDILYKPVACLDFGPSKTNVGDTVLFDLSGSYGVDGRVISYFVDFGDGKTTRWVPSPLISHFYASPGLFFPQAQVQDNRSRYSEMLVAGPIFVETGQNTRLDGNGYIMLEITSGRASNKYTIHPDEQMLDGRCDFDVNADLRLIIARNTADGGLEGVYSAPYMSEDIDILEISDNGSVALSVKEPDATTRVRLGVLESWPTEKRTSRFNDTRITNYGIWSKSRFRYWSTPVSIPLHSSCSDTCLLQTGDGLYRLVWRGYNGLWWSVSPDARSWSAPSRLPVGANTTSFDGFHMIQDRNGTFWVVWSNFTHPGTNRYDLWISSSKDFIGWSAPTQLPNDTINTGFDEHDPFLMQDHNGLYRIAFSSERHGQLGIFFTASNDCSNWSYPVYADAPYEKFHTDLDFNPMLLQDSNHRYWLIWNSQESSKRSTRLILYSTSTNGLAWSTPARFSIDSDATFDGYVRFSQDPDGTYWLISQYMGDLVFSCSKDGLDWYNLVQTKEWSFGEPSILIDRAGRRLLSYCGYQILYIQEFPKIDNIIENTNWIKMKFSDTTPPWVLNASVNPANQTPGGVVEINARVLDNRGVDKVVLNITGPKKFRPLEVPMNRSGPESFSYSGVFKQEGNYTVLIKARDAAGNEAVSGALSFTVSRGSNGEKEAPLDSPEPSARQVLGWSLVNLACCVIIFTIWMSLRKRHRRRA